MGVWAVGVSGEAFLAFAGFVWEPRTLRSGAACSYAKQARALALSPVCFAGAIPVRAPWMVLAPTLGVAPRPCGVCLGGSRGRREGFRAPPRGSDLS